MARAHAQPTTKDRPLQMSYVEWQAWYGKEERNRGEWVRGEVVPYMPPTVLHQRIATFLTALMLFYARHKNLGDVFISETELWLPRSQAARQPDISFIARQHADRLTTHRLDGYADLVVEIISPDSVTRDRLQKFAEYQEAGIPEYWIIDPRPRRLTVTLFVLDERGRYQEQVADANGRMHSRTIPGLWINPAWFWQEPRPKPYEMVARIMSER